MRVILDIIFNSSVDQSFYLKIGALDQNNVCTFNYYANDKIVIATLKNVNVL